ncbi:hypothetical protein STAS_26663 [Striga asiatica]|uniref:Uncharacterized protein n=1 Tax=Striga asiatica TaxID=4170 RepID=A0A5A7QWH1_STRAF|nr:hypothetical protein STAS_26663 [Striga asiatica]
MRNNRTYFFQVVPLIQHTAAVGPLPPSRRVAGVSRIIVSSLSADANSSSSSTTALHSLRPPARRLVFPSASSSGAVAIVTPPSYRRRQPPYSAAPQVIAAAAYEHTFRSRHRRPENLKLRSENSTPLSTRTADHPAQSRRNLRSSSPLTLTAAAHSAVRLEHDADVLKKLKL